MNSVIEKNAHNILYIRVCYKKVFEEVHAVLQ